MQRKNEKACKVIDMEKNIRSNEYIGFSQKKNWGCGIIIIVYCTLKPIYLFDSGSMQLCDFFLILSFLYLLIRTKGKFPIPNSRKKILLLMSVFILYQLIINACWYIVYPDSRLLLSILFFFFNYLSFYIIIMIETIIGTEMTVKSFLYGCLYSVLVASLGALISVDVNFRDMGWFNNPNQLGYYAVIVMTVALFFHDRIKKISLIVMFGASIWLILVSGSKAAFLGIIIMAFVYVPLGSENKDLKYVLRTIFLLVLVLVVLFLFFYSEDPHITSNATIMYMRNRISQMSSEADSDLGTGRGYNRIFETGVHFFLGMGEGAYYRFDSLHGKEVHSTYVSLLVSYGLLGFCLLSVLFFLIVKKKNKTMKNLSCLSGILLYFVTHNGIRNTLFWILLAIIYICNFPRILVNKDLQRGN